MALSELITDFYPQRPLAEIFDLCDKFSVKLIVLNLNQPRPRPIIVKIRCVRDKRLILSNTRKLVEVNEFEAKVLYLISQWKYDGKIN